MHMHSQLNKPNGTIILQFRPNSSKNDHHQILHQMCERWETGRTHILLGITPELTNESLWKLVGTHTSSMWAEFILVTHPLGILSVSNMVLPMLIYIYIMWEVILSTEVYILYQVYVRGYPLWTHHPLEYPISAYVCQCNDMYMYMYMYMYEIWRFGVDICVDWLIELIDWIDWLNWLIELIDNDLMSEDWRYHITSYLTHHHHIDYHITRYL